MKNSYFSLYSIKQLLSNFEPQKGGKTKQLPGLEKSQVAYKKKVYTNFGNIQDIIQRQRVKG